MYLCVKKPTEPLFWYCSISSTLYLSRWISPLEVCENSVKFGARYAPAFWSSFGAIYLAVLAQISLFIIVMTLTSMLVIVSEW